METVELLRTDVYGFVCPASLDLPSEQRPENVQKRALARHIMDIYQLKRYSQVQKELRSAPLWTCQLGESQKKSGSERLSGILWTFIS